MVTLLSVRVVLLDMRRVSEMNNCDICNSFDDDLQNGICECCRLGIYDEESE